jgi:hypothetical protein
MKSHTRPMLHPLAAAKRRVALVSMKKIKNRKKMDSFLMLKKMIVMVGARDEIEKLEEKNMQDTVSSQSTIFLNKFFNNSTATSSTTF